MGLGVVCAALAAAVALCGCGKGPEKPADFEPVGKDQALKSGKAQGTPRGAYMQSKGQTGQTKSP